MRTEGKSIELCMSRKYTQREQQARAQTWKMWQTDVVARIGEPVSLHNDIAAVDGAYSIVTSGGKKIIVATDEQVSSRCSAGCKQFRCFHCCFGDAVGVACAAAITLQVVALQKSCHWRLDQGRDKQKKMSLEVHLPW